MCSGLAPPANIVLGQNTTPSCSRHVLLLADKVKVQPPPRRELHPPPRSAGQRCVGRHRRSFWRMRVARQDVAREHLKRSIQEVKRRLRLPPSALVSDDARNTQCLERPLAGQYARVRPEPDHDRLALAVSMLNKLGEGTRTGTPRRKLCAQCLSSFLWKMLSPRSSWITLFVLSSTHLAKPGFGVPGGTGVSFDGRTAAYHRRSLPLRLS